MKAQVQQIKNLLSTETGVKYISLKIMQSLELIDLSSLAYIAKKNPEKINVLE